MDKIKISAVSYTNTKPFIYGIEHSSLINKINLDVANPAVCAKALIDNQTDIGLVPVAAIPNIPRASIITDYCISSVGAVNSVFIFSNVAINHIKSLTLDPQSITSNHLAKVLLKFYFKTEVEFITDQNMVTDAKILIGDRTFGEKNKYNFVYDLGQEWMNFTGLPFVYAVWVANKPIDNQFIDEFNMALKLGVDSIEQVLRVIPTPHTIDLADYLKNKLDFHLTPEKIEVIHLFLKYCKSIV